MEYVRRIYVHQFGGWWSFTVPEWQSFVKDTIASRGAYAMPDSKALRCQPLRVRRDFIADHTRYQSQSLSVRVVQPLDWDVSDWQYELEELGI